MLLNATMGYSVSPPIVALGPSGQQHFKVQRAGAPPWTVLTPGTGSIAADGTFTAPAAISHPATSLVLAGDVDLAGIGVVMLAPSDG